LQAIIAPTLELQPGRGLRFAVGLNDEPLQQIDTLADRSNTAWEQAVLDGVRTVQIPLHFKKPGPHKLRIYLVDPALVLQKLILDTGGLQPSYLGPRQSPFLEKAPLERVPPEQSPLEQKPLKRSSKTAD
jgi:hypothetical protein